MSLTITAAELERFAPKAKAIYVETLLANLDVLADAGILENKFRLAHFIAQCAAETGGFVVLRESLAYRPARLRQVWPSRFANKSDAYLADLCADQVKLADSVYGGRMGNRKGTSDGYDFRGGGFLQTTGRYSVEKYCKQIGVAATPGTLDDLPLCLKMACAEWRQSGCNAWADKNDLLRVSKTINTGSATSNIMPVGMEHRKHWLAIALKVWGDAAPLAHVADITAGDLVSRTIRDANVLKTIGGAIGAGAAAKGVQQANTPAPPAPPAVELPSLETVSDQIGVMQKVMEGIGAVSQLAVDHYWIAGILVGAAAWYYGRRIIGHYIEDIRTGRRQPIFKVTKTLVGD